MPGARAKSQDEQISFLLAVIENAEMINYEQVAKDTGLYKAGKYVKQALDGLKKKYGSAAPEGKLPGSSTPNTSSNMPGGTRKRGKPASKEESPSKKIKKSRVRASDDDEVAMQGEKDEDRSDSPGEE